MGRGREGARGCGEARWLDPGPAHDSTRPRTTPGRAFGAILGRGDGQGRRGGAGRRARAASTKGERKTKKKKQHLGGNRCACAHTLTPPRLLRLLPHAPGARMCVCFPVAQWRSTKNKSGRGRRRGDPKGKSVGGERGATPRPSASLSPALPPSFSPHPPRPPRACPCLTQNPHSHKLTPPLPPHQRPPQPSPPPPAPATAPE